MKPTAPQPSSAGAGEWNTVVTTDASGCRRCYACIRRCPAHAARVHAGQVDVMRERCIGCGQCVAACPRGVRAIANNLPQVKSLLASKQACVMLAPSFVAASDARPGQMVAALRRVGFAGVYEVALGADLVSRQYRALHEREPGRLLITSPCSAAVTLIQKHAPELLEYLAPILSPMAAMGKVLKLRVRPGCRTVFAGPCAAKLSEARNQAVSPWVDVAVTFHDVVRLLDEKGINLLALDDEEFDMPRSSLGALYPLSGGLLRSAEIRVDLAEQHATHVCGTEEILDLVRLLWDSVRRRQADRLTTRWYELQLCDGCIAGPGLEPASSLFSRRERVIAYLRSRRQQEPLQRQDDELAILSDLDLSRSFVMEHNNAEHAEPYDGEPGHVWAIDEGIALLAPRQIEKDAQDEDLDCGACGYRTCHEKAIAVQQGMADAHACLPHLVERLESLIDMVEDAQTATKETQAKLARAERLASAGQFLVAHELKAPLGAVEGYLRLLQDGAFDDDPDKRSHVLRRCLERTRALQHLVQDLLEIARREQVDNKCSHEPADAEAVVRRVVDAHKDEAEARGIRIAVQAEPLPSPPPVHANELERMLANLVSNAVKYNRDGGQVTIRIQPRNGTVHIEVQDTGIGMNAQERERLGEDFYRIKNEHTRHIVGTGLGIALVTRMVKTYGGALEVDSSPGVGSTFRLVLPAGERQSASPCAERKP